jgi:hypothetical protein
LPLFIRWFFTFFLSSPSLDGGLLEFLLLVFSFVISACFSSIFVVSIFTAFVNASICSACSAMILFAVANASSNLFSSWLVSFIFGYPPFNSSCHFTPIIILFCSFVKLRE